MFAEPTIDDFVARIEDHLQRSLSNARDVVKVVEHRQNAAGCYRSGNTVAQIFRDVLAEFDRGIEGALQRFRHSTSCGKLDACKMREILGLRLDVYRQQMKDATKHEKLRGFSSGAAFEQIINEKLAEFDKVLSFQLRQSDVGFQALEQASMRDIVIVKGGSNNIITGDGNIAQQGTRSSEQAVNAGDIAQALKALENELASSQLSKEHQAEIKADIATITAQLAKQAPSTSIVKEAAMSLLRIAEGTVAGAMSSVLAEHARGLARMVGLS